MPIVVKQDESMASQLWLGSIPLGNSEADCIEDVVANGIPRPTKIIVRETGDGRKYGICYFPSAAAAKQAYSQGIKWRDGTVAEIRLYKPNIILTHIILNQYTYLVKQLSTYHVGHIAVVGGC